jgi:hypothetical protein
VHERAHILFGHVDGVASYQICRGRCEVEAESVAYLVCTSSVSTDGDIELVRKTADRVVTVARSIVSDLAPADEAA